MTGEIGRLDVLAAIVVIGGLFLCVRGTGRLGRAVRDRFTFGAPYRRGMIADRATGLLMEVVVLAVGLALAFLAWAQRDFMPNRGTTRVALIEARRTGWGKVAVRIVPDPLYVSGRVLGGEVSGARWALAGDFISWHRGLAWIGLRDGQRLRYLVGTQDSTGTTPDARAERTPLDPLPPGAARLLRVARFLPFLEVRTESSPWFPLADRQVMTLYCIGPGYLAEVVAEGSRGHVDSGAGRE